MKKLIFTLLISLSALLLTNWSFAATKTSAGSGNWNTAGTWSPNGVPASGDAVIIAAGHTVTVTADASCASITFSGTGATLTVNTAITLTVSGAVTVNSKDNANWSTSITGAGTINCASLAVGTNINPTSDRTTTLTSSITAITISGNLSLYSSDNSSNQNNATFNLSTGTITVNGSVITTNEDNTQNISKMTMATGSQNGILVLGGVTPFNLGSGTNIITLNGTSTTVNYNRAGTQTAYATTYTNLTLSGSGAKTTTGATVNGTLSMEGTATATGSSPSFGASSVLQYKGSALQTPSAVEFPSSSGPNSLTINNSNGVSFPASFSRTVPGTLTMTSGNITTGANVLTLGSSTSVRGTLSHSSGQIITGSTGGFKRWFTNATASGVLFPVGTSTNMNMITLSFTVAPSAGGSLTAKFIASDPGTNSVTPISDAGYTVDAYSSRGYWQIDAADGLTGGTYDISLRGLGFNPLGSAITNFAHLRILKRPAAGNNWTVNGTHLDASQNSNSDPIINRTGLSGFSQFAMGGNSTDGNPLDGPLPVELTSFTSNVNGRNILLNWTTATETNNSGFEIEKQYSVSSQYSDWQKIGFVTGSGTKSTPTNYSYNDSKLNAGKYNYRLKQIDYNGNFEYFNLNNEVVIGNPDKFNVSQNYPNPFNPTTKIDYNIPLDSKVTIKIYDISGKEVKTLVNETKQAGYYTVEFSGIDLSSGMYFYRLTAGSFTDVKKMLMIK